MHPVSYALRLVSLAVLALGPPAYAVGSYLGAQDGKGSARIAPPQLVGPIPSGQILVPGVQEVTHGGVRGAGWKGPHDAGEVLVDPYGNPFDPERDKVDRPNINVETGSLVVVDTNSGPVILGTWRGSMPIVLLPEKGHSLSEREMQVTGGG